MITPLSSGMKSSSELAN